MTDTISREEALAAFDAQRQEHQEFLDSIPRERMTEPGATGPWSAKDVVAHLTAWRLRTLGRVESAAAGQPEPPAPWPAELEEDDEINEWFYQQHRDEPLDEVLANWDESFDRLRAAVVAMPEEMLYDPAHFPWLEGARLVDAVRNGFLGHFKEEHEATLREWLARE